MSSTQFAATRRRGGLRVLAGIVLSGAAAACSSHHDGGNLPGEAAPTFELLSDDPAVAGHEPAPAAEDDLLLADDFDALDERWSEISRGGTAPSTRPHVEIVAEGAGARGIAMLSPGVGGLHAQIETTRTDAVLVTVRLRSFSVARDALLRASNVTEERPARRPLTRTVTATAGFTEWTLVLDRCRERTAVQVSLVPGDRPLAVDRIVVRCLRPVEGLWLAPPADGAPPLPRAHHRVEGVAMDAAMEGFFVPTRGTLRWRARVPLRAPRLDLETSLLGGDRGGRAEWTIAIDGVALARRSEAVPPPASESPFSPWVIPLDRFAGREVAIELRCGGDRDVVGFVGAPRVLGSAPPAAPSNVVLISLDTLRPDRIGRRKANGGSLTPRLDELVARGTLFTDASSTSSWTLPAHASLMTGQHPLVHGALDSDREIDAQRSQLLAERFRRQGYATAAFTAGAFLDPRFGFAHGFDAYSVRDPCGLPGDERSKLAAPGRPVTSDADVDATPRRAFDWVRRHADAPFFLFLHTYHVHEYDDAAHDGADEQRLALIDRADRGEPKAVAELVRRYDACVTETDRDLVGGVVDLLDSLDLRERTLIAVVSDHGEEFLEHGGFRHGLTLHDEVGSVALLLAGPGVPRGERIATPVSLTAVAPTLARLAGLPPDPRGEDHDLFAPDDGEPRALLLHMDHYCVNHLHVRGEALWLGDWQVQRLWNERGEATLTFERRDPRTGGFAAAEPSPALRAQLERRLDAEIVARLQDAPAAGPAGEHELPQALRERLQALGYTGH